MNKKKLTIICSLLAATLLVAGISIAVSPSTARTLTCVTWNGIASPSDLALSSDYLVRGGQIVDVGYVTGTRDFSICVYNGNDKNWSAQVTSSDAGNLTASLSNPVALTSVTNAQSLTLTLTVAASPYSPTQATEATSATAETMPGESSSETATPTPASYPETADAQVTLSCNGETFSATFRMHFYDATGSAGGNSVASVSPYFGQYIPVQVVGGDASTLLSFSSDDGKFPAGTAYTVDNLRTVLYGTGYIICPAGKRMSIDFTANLGSMSNNITITPNGGSAYNVSKLDVEEFPDNLAVVLTESNGLLPVMYKLGGMNPSYSLDKYIFDGANASLSHIDTPTTILSEGANGYAQMAVNGLDAGTYVLSLTWNDGNFDICSLSRTIFIRHDAAKS